MLACIWGGDRYAWDSRADPRADRRRASRSASALVVARAARRRPDRAVRHCCGPGSVAVASAALFLGTAALFAVTVFVPLFLQTTTGATPTEAGLLLVPMMLGITVSTNALRPQHRAHRPLQALPGGRPGADDASRWGCWRSLAGDPSQLATGVGLAVFGLGFGMVTQVLIVAVQNGVDRRELGIATATTSFFRALGGAVGAAVLGAVFAAQAGATASQAGGAGLGGVLRADVIDGVQAVFAVAAPLAAIGLLVVLLLEEVPLRTAGAGSGERPAQPAPARSATPRIADWRPRSPGTSVGKYHQKPPPTLRG